MKRLTLIFVVFLLALTSCLTSGKDVDKVRGILYSDLPEAWSNGEQTYEANWASLDARQTPEWFGDAKFGIFIHWGIYSVPAWAPVGVYSEWYQYFLETGSTFGLGDSYGNAIGEYHRDTYGRDFSYYDFADDFEAEEYDPAEWAELFEESGAKYVVTTSKHHEGYSLWDDEIANKTWGFPWNSVSVGSKRDLIGELKDAMEGSDVKFGLYYSLYEWFNPLWKGKVNKEAYVTEHMIPQLKNLMTKYSPEVLWTDGEWDLPMKSWYSSEILKWVFNNAPNKDTVVVNDRWGSGSRHKHGSFYTTEYGSGLKDTDKPWEECRGIGFSFGYNQNEEDEDYMTGAEIVMLLCDVVAKGGNLLLDIGPKADGTIPEIMQLRLRETGAWLKAFGEAIYGSRTWKTNYQWSDGEIPDIYGKELSKDYSIIKQTLEPDPGMAVKELYFTQKDGYLYVFVPKGASHDFVIKDVSGSNISVYSMTAEKSADFELVGNSLSVTGVASSRFEGYPAVYRIQGIN
ncbi:MAG: alpha-L-fucosidase [Spirochaetales bacterium]|nr:alpha-L-fucosidase [Spirochaetales bacterium]